MIANATGLNGSGTDLHNASGLDFTTITEQISGFTNFSVYRVIKAYILNNSTNGATVKLQANIPEDAGTYNITLKQGSHIIIKRMPNGNFGNFI